MDSPRPSGRPTSVIITGGGTAGHTNPGVATALALVSRGIDPSNIHFVGGERGNEAQIVADAGFSIDLLPGRGIQRKLTTANVRAAIDLGRGLWRAMRIVRKRRPAVVLCLGGYAAFGASAAAVLQRVPLVVTEQNARASAVNSIMARFAKASALPFPGTDLPRGVLTGNPILPSFLDAVENSDPASLRDGFGARPNDSLVVAWAGSLGATRINSAVRELAELWRDRSDVVLYHVVGRRDWPDYRDAATEFADSPLRYEVVEYEDRMPDVLVAADFAICRAGASTVAELAVTGLPSLLIPLPGAPRDHQTANSEELVRSGASLLANDRDVTGELLDSVVSPVLANKVTLATMSRAAAALGRPGAGDAVAKLVVKAGDLIESNTAGVGGGAGE